MSKIQFPFVKLINTMAVLLPFVGCWLMYYEPRTLTEGSRQVSVLMLFLFCLVFYLMCYRLDGFRISTMRIGELVLSQTLAVMLADAFVYIIIWMLSIHLPNILPGIGALVCQCAIILCWNIVAHRIYFKNYRPLRTAVVYDVRQGMEELIKAYGLETRFDVQGIYPIEDVLEDPDCLGGMEVVFMCGIHSQERNIVLKYCTYNDIMMYILPRVGDVMMSGAERMHMFHLPMLRSKRNKTSAEYQLMKRIMDIVLSLAAIVVASPIMLAAAIAVKMDGGPALYKQVRLTKDGKKFEILKFRSMRVDAEKYSGAVLSAGENDPRITRVGRFIRACRVDELPQLINILRGDMSIVGPRPERPEIAEEYEKELPEFRLRLQVKAGLTGYAQVYGKYNTTPYDKLLMDLMYISRQSLLEDLSIMLATLKVLASKESTEGFGEENVSMVYEARRRRSDDISA